jgi:hypothetical protein
VVTVDHAAADVKFFLRKKGIAALDKNIPSLPKNWRIELGPCGYRSASVMIQRVQE